MVGVVLGLAAAKFIDPLLLIAALVGAYPLRRWWSVFAFGILLACLYEPLAHSVRLVPSALPIEFSLAATWIAATMHAWLAYGVYWFFRHEVRLPSAQPWRGIAMVALFVAAASSVILPGAILATLGSS